MRQCDLQYGSEEGGMVIGITAAGSLLPATRAEGFCRDAPRVVPLERWDVDGSATGARFGSFVEGAEVFDASAFSISR